MKRRLHIVHALACLTLLLAAGGYSNARVI